MPERAARRQGSNADVRLRRDAKTAIRASRFARHNACRRCRFATRPLGNPQRPTDDPLLEFVFLDGLLARANPPAHRDACRVHTVGIAGEQRMPPVEVAALREEAIGAGRRQPTKLADVFRLQADAVVDLVRAALIVAAAAALAVEQTATDIGEVDSAALLLFKLDEAAASAAVAQALPFGLGHLDQALALPEGGIGRHTNRLLAP